MNININKSKTIPADLQFLIHNFLILNYIQELYCWVVFYLYYLSHLQLGFPRLP